MRRWRSVRKSRIVGTLVCLCYIVLRDGGEDVRKRRIVGTLMCLCCIAPWLWRKALEVKKRGEPEVFLLVLWQV